MMIRHNVLLFWATLYITHLSSLPRS